MSAPAETDDAAPLPTELLEILRCPATGAGLRQDGPELAAVDLSGDELGPRYPIRGGVPHLLAG